MSTFENQFLLEEKNKALGELACIADCLQLATVYMAQGDFKRAALHVDSITRSLKVLDKLKSNKIHREKEIEDALHELSNLGVEIHYLKMR